VWTDLVVLAGPRRTPVLVDGAERLAELYRWRDGAPSPGRTIVGAGRPAPAFDASQIDWRGFPEQDAVIAIAEGDLRELLRRRSTGRTARPSGRHHPA
jgi:hypothetical protein